MDHDRIDEIVDRHQGDAGSLVRVLVEIQKENGWLPKEALEKVSDKLGVPLDQVQHLATFYKAFSLTPRGRHEIHVCTGTACHVRGSARLLERVEDAVGIKPGETTLDSKFSLQTTNCLGCCAAGPVMVVDGEPHGKLPAEKVGDILNGCD